MAEASRAVVGGPELFARYAYPPNELGYCGPGDPAGLLVTGTPEASADIARRAREFEGAWVYLELIAEASGIAEPLDIRVVEAYWLGNDLLDGIDSRWFLGRLRERLRGQPGGQWAGGVPDRPSAVVPSHAFHVFEIYPWVGLLHRGNDVARSVLDQCRIRAGRVESADGFRARVLVSPLTWDGQQLGIGTPEIVDARWAEEGRSLLDGVAVGDRVSMHWDWICDVVTPAQVRRLESLERNQLAISNHRLASGQPPRSSPGNAC